MTAGHQELHFADAGEAADLAAFLARLIHYDRAAAVRLQAGGGVLAVFGRPPSFEVLAIRTARLEAIVPTDAASATAAGGPGGPGGSRGPGGLDTTVSAGEFADALDRARAERTAEAAGGRGLVVIVPQAVTGPPWAGVLPPRGGWRRVDGLPGTDEVRGAVTAAVAEFRARDAALPEERRTRAERDRIGQEIWSRTLGDTGLPLRAVHAAQSLGFLRPVRATAASAATTPAGARGGVTTAPGPTADPLVLLAAGGWLRLRTPYGSVAVRTSGFPGLSVTPA
ncbi:hypothetical protein ACH4VS_09155 [Streptomyces hygroscopicus]|uniref:hypothetical protein n=1 Tax=Streptomyces hygroscopicus TaxID=1912 RepID=UPI0008334D3B|nr:hypothetical protein [Streptomyces hygroscopicus]GLV75351.1 hypothetical protein Shyhy02_33510 [Streptomyces hygroscopicus subsp. hygroscopicus]